VVSRSDQYSESGLSDWLSPVALANRRMEACVWRLPWCRSTLSATNDHRSDFGIAHVYYGEKTSTGRRTHYSLVTGGAGFHSVLLYWNLLGFQF